MIVDCTVIALIWNFRPSGNRNGLLQVAPGRSRVVSHWEAWLLIPAPPSVSRLSPRADQPLSSLECQRSALSLQRVRMDESEAALNGVQQHALGRCRDIFCGVNV